MHLAYTPNRVTEQEIREVMALSLPGNKEPVYSITDATLLAIIIKTPRAIDFSFENLAVQAGWIPSQLTNYLKRACRRCMGIATNNHTLDKEIDIKGRRNLGQKIYILASHYSKVRKDINKPWQAPRWYKDLERLVGMPGSIYMAQILEFYRGWGKYEEGKAIEPTRNDLMRYLGCNEQRCDILMQDFLKNMVLEVDIRNRYSSMPLWQKLIDEKYIQERDPAYRWLTMINKERPQSIKLELDKNTKKKISRKSGLGQLKKLLGQATLAMEITPNGLRRQWKAARPGAEYGELCKAMRELIGDKKQPLQNAIEVQLTNPKIIAPEVKVIMAKVAAPYWIDYIKEQDERRQRAIIKAVWMGA